MRYKKADLWEMSVHVFVLHKYIVVQQSTHGIFPINLPQWTKTWDNCVTKLIKTFVHLYKHWTSNTSSTWFTEIEFISLLTWKRSYRSNTWLFSKIHRHYTFIIVKFSDRRTSPKNTRNNQKKVRFSFIKFTI